MSQASSVAVIDYGMGNLHSVASALESVGPGIKVTVTANQQAILAADRVVFPGVGAIRDCMAEIRAQKVDQVLAEVIARGTPLLGICVGMQALMDFSEENGGVECLGILPGTVRHFGFGQQATNGEHLKVPHMGWNQVQHLHDHPLWDGIADNSRFYFVHSYYVDALDQSQVAGRTEYGVPFAAAVAHNNIFAVQFHPEKSHPDGLVLLKNFLRWQA